MNSARYFQVERLAREFVVWRAVSDDDRAPAAAWWWSTALELRNDAELLPSAICDAFALPGGSTYADVANRLIEAIAAQKSLASPTGFPLKPKKHRGPAETDELATPPSSGTR